MTYTAQDFYGFYPEPPSAQDLANFNRAMVPNVMLFWDTASEDLIHEFAATVRAYVVKNEATGEFHPHTRFVGVALRMNDEVLFRDAQTLTTQLQSKIQASVIYGRPQLRTIILGPNEPDLGVDLRWHMPDGKLPNWGNQPPPLQPQAKTLIQKTADTVRRLASIVRAVDAGIQIVSPALRMHGYTEDDAPDPGLMTWRELLAPVWYGYGSPITGNDVHYYDGGWWVRDPDPLDAGIRHTASEARAWAERLAAARLVTKTNVDRFKHWVRWMGTVHHHLLYIAESNTNNSAMSELEHMEACIGKSKLLIHSTNAEGYVLGERVAMYCPFTFNGLGNAYPQEYIMQDPAGYELLRQHMKEEGFVDGH